MPNDSNAIDVHVVKSADRPLFTLPGVEFLAGAAPSRGSNELCVWMITVAVGHCSDAAHRVDRDEVFTVLSGSIRLQNDSEPLVAGDTAVVPAGAPIQLANAGAEPAQVIVAIRSGFRATMADGTEVGTPPWGQ